MTSRPCPVCSSREAEPRLRTRRVSEHGEPYSVIECAACRMLFTEPLPSDSEIVGLYDDTYYGDRPQRSMSWDRLRIPLHSIVLRHRARSLGRRQPGRILDVGCGDGDFLAFMKARGWEVHGHELSPAAAARARSKGVEVHQVPLAEAGFPAGSFDVVTLWHVLEHLPEPALVLAQIRSLLTDDGRLIIEVPNSSSPTRALCGESWSPLDVPRHLQHFSPATLTNLLNRVGFSPRRWTHFHPLDFVLSAMSFAERLRLLGRRESSHYFVGDFRRASFWVKARFLIAGPLVLLFSIPYSWIATLMTGNGEVARVKAMKAAETTPKSEPK